MEDLKKKLSEGVYVKSSGTTGVPKNIFRTPENLMHCNNAAIDSQKITKNSRIYTVCKMEHAGGLLAQTLPAFEVGAEVNIESFNAYKFCKKIKNFTHSHLTPDHAKAIRLTKSFKNLDLNNIWITCGSEPINWNLITDFVKKGCTFMVNWGMTEVGPCAINTVFKDLEKVYEYKKKAIQGTLMGDISYCDTKIKNGTLHVKGNISVYKNEWFDTKDLVKINKDNHFYIQGRSE